MNFFYQLALNFLFFLIYSIVGFKIIESTSYADFIQIGSSLPVRSFLNIIIFFSVVVFFSISSAYAVLSNIKPPEMKKGIALDDKDIEVTPEVLIDGKEENKDSLMDIIDDKSGKIRAEPAKPKKKKNKK